MLRIRTRLKGRSSIFRGDLGTRYLILRRPNSLVFKFKFDSSLKGKRSRDVIHFLIAQKYSNCLICCTSSCQILLKQTLKHRCKTALKIRNIGLQLLFKNRYDLNQIILENSEVIRNWPLLGSPKKNHNYHLEFRISSAHQLWDFFWVKLFLSSYVKFSRAILWGRNWI